MKRARGSWVLDAILVLNLAALWAYTILEYGHRRGFW